MEIPNIMKSLEVITSEICDKYCKFPDQYTQLSDDEDDNIQKLVAEHCIKCPLMQFLGE